MKYLIMRLFLLIIALFQLGSLNAQDFDMYLKKQDDKVKIPEIPESMSAEEFQLLSRDIRMMDMMYAAVVPGYIHFKAKEKRTGFVLLGLRTVGFLGLGASYVSAKRNGDTFLGKVLGTNQETTEVQLSDEWSVKVSDVVVASSIAVIFSTYLYDFLHGKSQLEKKQELIRYKYGIKLKLENKKVSLFESSYVPSISFNLQF